MAQTSSSLSSFILIQTSLGVDLWDLESEGEALFVSQLCCPEI